MEAGDEIELRGPIMTSKIPLSGLSEVDLVSSISYTSFRATYRSKFTVNRMSCSA